MKFRFTKLLSLLAVAVSLCLSLVEAQIGQPTAQAQPRLVVLLIVDGLGQHQLVQSHGRLAKGGLSRILDQGAWFTDAHYGFATTFTAAGHATVATGAYPYRHGLIANDWMVEGQRVYCVEDPQHKYLGQPTPEQAGTSPRNLRSWTLADQLRLATRFLSKVVGISIKDRGAILPVGKTGTAYWYTSQSGRFITSSYYRNDYPDWSQQFHRDNPQNKWFNREWTRSTEAERYPFAVQDGQEWYLDYKGLGTRFPFKLSGKAGEPGPEYYSVLTRTPFGDEYTLEFAKAAVEGEQLGRNPAGVPDLLCISLSSHDYITHLFGPESIQSFDHLVKLDALLADFLNFLDKSVGLDSTLLAVTADHGFAPSPEYLQSLRMEAGRLDTARLLADLNRHLEARFGAGPFVKAWWNPTFYFDHDKIRSAKIDAARLETEAVSWLRSQPGIAYAYTRSQIENGQLPDTDIAQKVMRSWCPIRSGDVFVVARPFWYLPSEGSDANAATHGSPHRYDTNVPILLFGRSIKAGRFAGRADVVDLVPTLAHLLSITAPDGAEGRVLLEALENAGR
ncbi:MAG: alkaline phosphatase family protein [Acidobacteria bacterium]|nr:MAG: alkaline phosphatase family protein [Acidobacteriota bacterium]